jgi:uncharacterized phage protein gp47/JayE
MQLGYTKIFYMNFPTYKQLLDEMLLNVSNSNPNLDTREGSVIFNALAPTAAELENVYVQLQNIMDETFADTATRPYLIRRAAERGLSPFPASYSILKGVFTQSDGSPYNIPLSSRFSRVQSQINYIAISKIADGEFRMQCETAGVIGNDYLGKIIPIQYLQNLATAELTELLIAGEDEENTDAFRQRYYESLNAQAFGGNVQDYKEKVVAIAGVGGVKVTPIWNGGGTVKLDIIASNFTVPTQDLIDEV